MLMSQLFPELKTVKVAAKMLECAQAVTGETRETGLSR